MNQRRKIFIALILCISLVTFCSSIKVTASEGSESLNIKLERHFIYDTLPLNLEEITSASDRIFTGICTNVEEIEDDLKSKLPVVKYTFKITEAIKGLQEKEEITFKQWQPTTKDASYEVEKKHILFLYPNSERGLTSPVGFLQGQFKVAKKGLIRRSEVVTNKSSNRGLNRNLRTQKKIVINEDKYINDYVESCSELGIPMRYQEFIKAVKYLVKK